MLFPRLTSLFDTDKHMTGKDRPREKKYKRRKSENEYEDDDKEYGDEHNRKYLLKKIKPGKHRLASVLYNYMITELREFGAEQIHKFVKS